MRVLLIICFLLSAVNLCSASRDHKKKSFKQDKKKAELISKDKQKLSKLSIQAKRMLNEGEGHRNHSNISGSVNKFQAHCPICQNEFSAIYIDRQPPEKGMDADFCKHTYNPSAYDFNMWSCTKCGYSNFPHIFHEKPKAFDDPKFSEKAKSTLRQLFIQYMGIDVNKLGYNLDQADVPTFMKYFLFKLSIPSSEFSNKLLGDFHLHYSWIHRQRFLAPIANPNLSLTISIFNEKVKNYAKRLKVHKITSKPELVLAFLQQEKFDPDQNTEICLALHYRAKCYDRMGNPKMAMHLMKEAIAKTLDPNLRKILISKKRTLLDEFEQSKLALKYIKLALRENAYGKETPQFIYLIGQLSKRIGLENLANLWINSSLKLLINYSEPIHALAKKELSKLPEFIDHENFEMDKILISSTINNYENQYIDEDNKNNPKFELKEVNMWLSAMEKACIKYYTELDFDPKNLKELIDVGLLKSHPKLSSEAIKFFKIEVNSKKTNASTRYKLSSIIPYEDSEGLFWPSITNGKISRLRQ